MSLRVCGVGVGEGGVVHIMIFHTIESLHIFGYFLVLQIFIE